MELNAFTFKILLLFFPGLLSSYLVDYLTIHRPKGAFFFLLQSFVLGIFSYSIYWGALETINYFWPYTVDPDNISFFLSLTKTDITKILFSFSEMAFVSGIAIALALIFSVVSKYKVISKAAHKIGVTKKFGELDVWGYLLNLKNVGWVTVRDHKNDLVYDGWVEAFSDDSKNAELLLSDVSLYKNSTGKRLYQVGVIYLSRNREDISIECRDFPISEMVKWKENEK
jgi:hypothetical protein